MWTRCCWAVCIMVLSLVSMTLPVRGKPFPYPAAGTPYPAMMRALSGTGYGSRALFTVGEQVGAYLAPGVPDGTAVFPVDRHTVRVLVNHELRGDSGRPYRLANGTVLRGARISFFDVDRRTRLIRDAGLAFSVIHDRQGSSVSSAAQLNERGASLDGLDRLCSAQGYPAGAYGLLDRILFSGEESSPPAHPHGGSLWALDVDAGDLWAVPALGRGAWENVTALSPPDERHIALLLGNDAPGAPLFLWLGEKGGVGDGSFLDRNGLVVGRLQVWRPLFGATRPEAFHGQGSFRLGRFVDIVAREPSKQGASGYDAQGYLDSETLQAAAASLGAFGFSRPEDLHTNPGNGHQAVFASTGRGTRYPADRWGALYRVEVGFATASSGRLLAYATLSILYDGDDPGNGARGIRNPDNLVWAGDGFVYVQEDRAVAAGDFGGVAPVEASVWRLDPRSGEAARIAVMDRQALAPPGVSDRAPGDLGNWESSGILDATPYFETEAGERLLLATVQAHGIRDGVIAELGLVQGGQLLWINRWDRIRVPRDDTRQVETRDSGHTAAP